MANDLNQCTFTGRLGKPVEIKYTPSGTAVANFSMAVGETWKDKATRDKKEAIEWVSVVCFGKLAEIATEYLSTDSFILIVGKLKTDTYEKDGEKKYKTKVVAHTMKMLGGRSDWLQTQTEDAGYAAGDDIDDVPF